MPPCQFMTACLKPAWKVSPIASDTVPVRSVECATDTHTWLPLLLRELPHDWIDASLVTATASKADDAASPCSLWDVRLELLFPGCTAKLEVLRRGVMIWIRRRLWREIRRYLTSTFGSGWSSDLKKLRQGPVSGHLRGVQEMEMDIDDADQGKNKRKAIDKVHVYSGKSTKRVYVGKQPTHLEIDAKNPNNYCLILEAEKVTEVLFKICWSSWWEWEVGSSLFFWQWGEEARLARDGMIPFITDALPKNFKKGRSLANNEHFDKIIEKLSTIVKREYIKPGKVTSLIDIFAVPKGDDIRLVYNGTSCGLNEATWAPNFWLPFPRSAIRSLDYNYYSVDIDLGEMFLNFPLHESIQASSGIDLSPFQKDLGIGTGNEKLWYCWTRNWMGARISPYSSVQYCSLAEELCRGHHTDTDNPLRWDVIVLNLPGSPNFYPSKPRVYKWDQTMGCLSGELVIFVNDGRITAKTVELAWRIARQVCSRFQYLGIQDATRKRKPPTRTPGAWAGAVFATTENTVTKTVTAEKWAKAQGVLESLNSQVRLGGDKAQLGYKKLEVAQGFLCHLSMTYDVLVPFLKGFHLGLAAHLSKRDQDGWKLTDKVWQAYIYERNERLRVSENGSEGEEGEYYSVSSDTPTPAFVQVTQHFRDDLTALTAFFEGNVPPIINDRCSSVQVVRYGFGDAWGTGFGSTIQTSQGLKYRIGVWGSDEEAESSNYKELENVVTTIEEEAAAGILKGQLCSSSQTTQLLRQLCLKATLLVGSCLD